MAEEKRALLTVAYVLVVTVCKGEGKKRGKYHNTITSICVAGCRAGGIYISEGRSRDAERERKRVGEALNIQA